MLPAAREGGELREAALAADDERQAHLFTLELDYRGREAVPFSMRKQLVFAALGSTIHWH